MVAKEESLLSTAVNGSVQLEKDARQDVGSSTVEKRDREREKGVNELTLLTHALLPPFAASIKCEIFQPLPMVGA